MKCHTGKLNLFFIVGCGRSGTTLLKTILNSSSKIAVTPETFFYGAITNEKTVEKYNVAEKIKILLSKWWIKDFGFTPQELQNNLQGIECTNEWDALFVSLLKTYADKHGVDCVGEKTPSHITKAEYFLEIFSGAKVICIFRDPRAVYHSYKKSNIGTLSVSRVISEWEEAYSIHSKLRSDSQYLCVRYEDLVTEPDVVLKSILGFLNVEYDDSMLDFYKRQNTGFSPEQAHHENTLKPLFKDSINEWEGKLNNSQIALIEGRLSVAMLDFGYNLTNAKSHYLAIYEVFSRIADILHKIAVRKPRQIIKAYKANKRHKT